MLKQQNVCIHCGVVEGEYHKKGCFLERCILCPTKYNLLVNCNHTHKDFKNSDREPFFHTENRCIHCNKENPILPNVSKKQFKYVIGKTYKENDFLCKSCFNFIKKLRDKIKRKNESKMLILG